MKYHINPETGDPKVCTASVRTCKYGEDVKHYSSQDDARKAYEQQMTRSTLSAVAGGKPKNLSDSLYDPIFPEELSRRGTVATLEMDLKRNPERSVTCPECGHRLGDASVALEFQFYGFEVKCKNCKSEVTSAGRKKSDFPVVGLNPDSATYPAVVSSNIPKMIWYHWSNKPNWAEAILEEGGPDRVHLGGEIAAADRKVAMEGMDNDAGFLYAVEVDESATIDEHIHDEEAVDFTVKDTNESDCVRYKNLFEDSGSISLSVKPKSVRVLGVRRFTEASSRALSTYFESDDVLEYIEKRFLYEDEMPIV
jgi:hypothetical protein